MGDEELYKDVDASKGESISNNRVNRDEVNQRLGFETNPDIENSMEEYSLPKTSTSFGTNFDYMQHQANKQLFNLENGIEENIGRPGFGDSYYDQYASDLWDSENLNELRAREQGFVSKIAGGLGRFATITTMGTVGNIVGTVTGLIEGTADALSADDHKWDAFWQGFWNNKVNQFVHSVIDTANEYMPAYESEYEKNLGVFESLLTGNFWANQIANMGWTSAAIISTVLTGGMGAASGASSIARTLGASKNTANWIYRLIGGFTGSMSEAATEAIENYDESKTAYANAINNDYQAKRAEIDNRVLEEFMQRKEALGLGKQRYDADGRPLPIVENPDLERRMMQAIREEHAAEYQALEQEMQDKYLTVDQRAKDAGTNTFGLNVLILGLSNTLGVFSGITTPMNNINRMAKGSIRNLWKGEGEKVAASKGELITLEALSPFVEGNEEMLQKVASETAKSYYGQYYNPEFTGQLKDYVDVAGETFQNVYSDKQAWKEFAAGFFTGLLGAGGIGHKTVKTDDGKRHTIRPEWTGGLIKGLSSGEISAEAERSASIYKEANDLYNKFVNDKNLQARTRLLIGTMADKEAMADAAENGDKKAFLDHEAEMLIRAIETFTDIGRMNDFKALVGNDINMSDDDIREFAAINSEEIKDSEGKGTGRYKSNLPVVDANGELLSDTEEGRSQIRERLKKDQEKINRLINAYSEAIEDTDAESNYSLNRDQLKMLTWAKMKAMDSEDRQNSLGESINENILWKTIYEAYLRNRTYRNDDDDEAYKALEIEASKLNAIIEEYNKNANLTEAQKKNKKIFESDYKNIKQAIDAVTNRRKAAKEEEAKHSELIEGDNKKTATEQLFEMLNDNVKGTLLASILAAKVAHKNNEEKTPIYFANIVADLLEESMGSEAAPIIKDINDMLKLNADRMAYDKMYREFMEAPEKITDMFNGILKESQDANFKRTAKKALDDYNENKDYFETVTDYLNSGFLSTEPEETKEKLRNYLIENSTDAYYKDLKERFKNRINDALDALDAEKNDPLVKNVGYTKEFINNSDTITTQQSLLYATKEDIIRDAINMGYSDTDAAQIAYNLTKIADDYRNIAAALADVKQKVDEAAEKKKAQGESPKSDNTVEITPTNVTDTLPQNISDYLAKYLLADGSKYGEKLVTSLKSYVNSAGLESIGDIVGKVCSVALTPIRDTSKDMLQNAFNGFVALMVADGGKQLQALNTVIGNILVKKGIISSNDKTSFQHLIDRICRDAANVPLFQSIRVQPFSLLPVQDNYDGIFINSEVKPEIEVIEDKNFVGDKAFVAGIEITKMPTSLKEHGSFKVTIVKPSKQEVKDEDGKNPKSKETEDKLRLQKAEEEASKKLEGKPIFNIANVDTTKVDVEEHDKQWKNDPTKSNKTLRIYLKDQHQKGYFELVKDEEDNYYSVHFKTASNNPKSAKYNAEQTDLSSKEERNILFEQLANAIPDGALVSTHGEISPAGERALTKLAQLINGAKVGERVVKSKETKEDVTIGIYQKDKANIEKNSVTTETASTSTEAPVTPVTSEDKNTTPQSRTLSALNNYIADINNKVFFRNEGHTYYIYIGEDVTKGREEFDRFLKDIKDGKATKDDYGKYNFTINTRSASTLRYGLTDYVSSKDGELSQKIGNDIDTLIRMVFQGYSPEDIKKELTYLVNEEDGIDGTVEIFAKIEEIKQAIWDAMKDCGGENCTIITDPINLIAKIKEDNGNEILAGTPDMLVIDTNGVIHIFDMKAKKIDNLISKDNPNAYRNENDYERYQTQLFAYAQMLRAAGFNVDTQKAHLIQFKTKRTADSTNPTFLGISELVNDGEGKAITDNIYAFDTTGLVSTTSATSISDIGEAIKNEKPAPTQEKKKSKEAKEDEKVLDVNDEAQQSFEQKIKEAVKDTGGLTQWGYVIPNYNDFTKSEARGVYNRSNDFRVKYLRENGAYDFLDRGKVKANALVYLKDVTPELRQKYPNYDYSYYHYIGVYVKDEETGKLQIVGILDSDSMSRGGISEKDRAEGNIRGNTSHSINNNIMVALETVKAFHTTNRGAKYRREGLTDTGYVFNNNDEKVAINLQATATESKKFEGYYTVKNADGELLRVAKVAPGRIQTRPNKSDETRDLVPITSVKVNSEDFSEAFKNKRAFVGVLIGQNLKPTILDCDGEVRNDIQLKVPNMPSGSMIVVFKGADNEWKCSAIIGNDFNSDDSKDKNNKVAKNIDYHLLHTSADGEYYGLAEDLYISSIEVNGLLDKEEIQSVTETIEKGFDNVFNFLNRKPTSVSYDYDSKVATLTFTVGTSTTEISINTIGKSREAIKEELYNLLSVLNERYSLAQEIFLSDDASTEAKKQRLNSIIENSSTNIDEFTTRNTKVVLSYYDAASFVLPTGTAKESYTSRANYNEIAFTLNGVDYVLRKNASGASKKFQLRNIDSNRWTEDNQTIASTFGYLYDNVNSAKALSSTMDVFLGKLYEILAKYDIKSIHLTHTNELNNGILHITETTIGNNLVNPEMYYDIRANKFLPIAIGKERFSEVKEQPISTPKPETASVQSLENTSAPEPSVAPETPVPSPQPEKPKQQEQPVTPPAPTTTNEKKRGRTKKGVGSRSVSEKIVKQTKNSLFTHNEGEYNAHTLLDKVDTDIAKLLKSVIAKNVSITVLSDEEFDNKYGTETNGIFEHGKVILKLSSSNNTLIHELCHLTVPSILQNEEAAAKLTEIFDKYKKYLQINPELGNTYSTDGVSVRYATSTLYEFISELFSNTEVANILKEIPEDYFVKDDLSNKYVVNPKYRNEETNALDTKKVTEGAKKGNLLRRILRSIVAFFTQRFSRSSVAQKPVNNLYALAYKAGTELIESFDANADVTTTSDISINDKVYSTLYNVSDKAAGLFDVKGKNSITIDDFIQEVKESLKDEDENVYTTIDKLVNAFDLNTLSKETETASTNVSWNKIGLVLMQLAVLENITNHSNFGEVSIFEKVSFANYNSKYNKNTQGLSNKLSNNVYINDGLTKFQKISVALHEIIHTITSLELTNNAQFREEVSGLFNKIKDSLANTTYLSEYGLTNEKEFMAEALSNPHFMGILASIKVDGNETNVLNDTTVLIKKMLRNLSIRKTAEVSSYTALDKITQIIKKYGKIYSRQDLLSKYYYERINRKSLRDYESKVDNVIDFESPHSIFIRTSLKKLNKAGIINRILPMVQPFNKESINREGLRSLFVAILPAIKGQDFTGQEIDNMVDGYYDYAFGYTEDTKSAELYALVETLGNHSNKLSLSIGANTQINKINFAVNDKNDNFASPLQQQIDSCSI